VAKDADNSDTVSRLRVALDEVREDGNAAIVENVDDRLVARLRSEFDR